MNEASVMASVVFDALARLDLSLFHIINGPCGARLLDYAAWFAQNDNLFSVGMIMAAYWWFWFTPGSREDHRRKTVSAALGTILALVTARALALSIPFRVRPIYAAGIDYHPPSLQGLRGIHELNMEDWSSFPSDHAALVFALAYGLLRLSRPVGILAMLFAAIWVGLARIYLGIHYPSDVIVGGAIGVTCAYITGRINNRRIFVPVLQFERNYPHVFYAAMFIIASQISTRFDDVRKLMRGSLLVLHALGFESVGLIGALAADIGTAVFLCLVISFPLWLRRCRAK